MCVRKRERHIVNEREQDLKWDRERNTLNERNIMTWSEIERERHRECERGINKDLNR